VNLSQVGQRIKISDSPRFATEKTNTNKRNKIAERGNKETRSKSKGRAAEEGTFILRIKSITHEAQKTRTYPKELKICSLWKRRRDGRDSGGAGRGEIKEGGRVASGQELKSKGSGQ